MTLEERLTELGMGEIIELAEGLGWVDPGDDDDEDWDADMADGTEDAAIEFLTEDSRRAATVAKLDELYPMGEE